MKNKECKIVCGDKTVAKISGNDGEFKINCTEEGKKIFKKNLKDAASKLPLFYYIFFYDLLL